MNIRTNIFKSLIAGLLLVCVIDSQSSADVFVSFSGLGEGNANAASTVSLEIGDQGVAYIWLTDDTKIDTGAFLDILSSDTEVVRFTGSTTFNPDIVSGGSVVDLRWQAVSNGTLTDGLVDEMSGIRFFDGTGILPSQVTGSAMEDQFHDATSAAFLFGSVNFMAVANGNAELSMKVGSGLIVDSGISLSPTFRSGFVTVSSVPEPNGIATLMMMVASLLVRRSRHA